MHKIYQGKKITFHLNTSNTEVDDLIRISTPKTNAYDHVIGCLPRIENAMYAYMIVLLTVITCYIQNEEWLEISMRAQCMSVEFKNEFYSNE